MTAQFYSIIDEQMDPAIIEEMLLTLEKDHTKYLRIKEQWKELKGELTFLEKINPFDERDKKGEILKEDIKLQDIENVYNDDMKVISQLAKAAILSVSAFNFKFRYLDLIQSINDISASGPKGAWVIGREKAMKKAAALNQSLTDQYGSIYSDCPKLSKLLKRYISYLIEPYHLPHKLKH
ncbi:MAG: hypothetical protein KJP00_07305 [Bacteroidia bacterium]|nr:hypothetical protein [Bacteroidia bacterium]